MAAEKSEGVVLRGADFSETSRVVTLLTPDRGRLVVMAKGARRKNSPLASALDAMNRVALVYHWKAGRAVQLLTEAALLDGYGGIKSKLERSAYAAFPLELTLKVAHEEEPSAALYAALVRGLESLACWEGDARAHACWQVLQLLDAAGFSPVTDRCAECSGMLAGHPVFFRLHAGLCCADCGGGTRLEVATTAALRELARGHMACPPVDAGPELFRLLRDFAAHQLDTDFRSVRVLEDMFE